MPHKFSDRRQKPPNIYNAYSHDLSHSPALWHTNKLPLLPKEPAHSSQHTVLLGVIRVILAGYLKKGRESSRISIDSMSYPFGDLQLYQNSKIKIKHRVAAPTCWLIKSIPISFLSDVNLSNASSITDVSVLPSTTRKFFCESGGAVTCYSKYKSVQFLYGVLFVKELHTPTPAKRRPVTESCRRRLAVVGRF